MSLLNPREKDHVVTALMRHLIGPDGMDGEEIADASAVVAAEVVPNVGRNPVKRGKLKDAAALAADLLRKATG